MNEMLLGYSQTDITPVKPVELIGFGNGIHSVGIRNHLKAQVSIWKFQLETCCLITIDHIGFSREHADLLREDVGRVLSVPKEKVMICFSHTHSAPNDSIETSWYLFLCGQIRNCVKEAAGRLRQVKASWGNAFADIGVNRRDRYGALDRRIGILKVTDAENGKPVLLLLRITAHANVLKADNHQVSSDYFGAVRELLQEAFGCPVMLTQGASGNIAPKYFSSALTPPDACDERFIRSETALTDMAKEILKQTVPVVERLVPHRIDFLSMISRCVELTADVPALNQALSVAAEAKKEAGIDGNAWLEEVRRLHELGIRSQSEQVEIQYFAVKDGCLCGVPNEIMCEFALRAQKAVRNNCFYFGGYTNGCSGYFPTEEEYDQGGYEVFWSMLQYFPYHGRVFPLRRDSAEQLVDAVRKNCPVRP